MILNVFGLTITNKKDKSENKTRKNRPTKEIVDYTSSISADAETTKGLYYNSLNGYKLAGGLAYNMIAVPIAFCGFPIAIIDGSEKDQEYAAEFFEKYNQEFVKILRQCHREGTIWIYPWYDSKNMKVRVKFIEDSWVSNISRDPLTGDIVSITTSKSIQITNPSGNRVTVDETVIYTEKTITTKYESSQYSGLKNRVQRNVLGILPIGFLNMADGDEKTGHSDYSRTLPYLSSYHRTSLKMNVDLNDFRTKMILNVEDPDCWATNQGFDDLPDLLANTTPEAMQVIAVGTNEKVDFITAKALVDGYIKVLDIDYKLIVESSSVPELFWGLKQPGNANTAEEAMTTLINYINEKRSQNSDKFQLLMESMLILDALSRGDFYTIPLKISWNQLDAVSDASRSEIFKNFCDGISKAFQGQTLTIEQAYELWVQNYPSITNMTYEEFEIAITKATTLIKRKTSDNDESDLGRGLDL